MRDTLRGLAESLRDEARDAGGFYRIRDRRRTTDEVQALADGYIRLHAAVAFVIADASVTPSVKTYLREALNA